MKTSSDTPEEIFQTELYHLLWYLSGWGGRFYDKSARTDMVEGVLETLCSAGLLNNEYHNRAIKLVDQSTLEGHPFRELMAACFKNMPRERDPVIGGVNAIRWVAGE